MAIHTETYGAAVSYTDESLLGMGAIKGKNCTIQSITEGTNDAGEPCNIVVFAWTADDGTAQTSTMYVKNGMTTNEVQTYVASEVTTQIESQLDSDIQEKVDEAVADAMSGDDDELTNEEIDSWF